MMVVVTGFHKRGGQLCPIKTIRCSEDRAKEFVKMLFDLGFDDVSVV